MKLPGIKRILPLILTVLLLPVLLAVPARADDDIRVYLNVLDYTMPNDGNTPWVGVTNNSVVSFSLPYYTPINYVDILVEIANGVVPSNVYLKYVGRPNQEEVALTITHVGDNLYRIYGKGANYTQDVVGLKFVISGSAASSITFKDFNISYLDTTAFYCPIIGNVKDLSVTPMRTYQFVWSDTASSAAVSWVHNSGDFDAVFQIDADILYSDWVKFDYIDLLFSGTFADITSILIEHDLENVPCEVTYLGSSSNYQQYAVAVRIDLSQLERHSNSSLSIDIYGLSFPGQTNKFQLDSCIGYATSDPPNLLSYWFFQLEGWFDELISAVGGNNDASGVQDSINSAVGELEQAGAALDAVQRPDIGHVNIDVAGMVDPAGLSGVASIVGLFTGNTLIYSIMLMFLTLALISYIIFGKR